MNRPRSPYMLNAPSTNAAAARIAIIDDDPELCELIERLLRQGGYEPIVLPDGKQLDAVMESGQPDVIILDVMLPVRDGFEICRDLRRKGYETPIIMLTARDEEMDRVLGLELGADDYVTKPFSGRELLARIKAVLRRRQEGSARYRAPLEYQFSDWTFRPENMEVIGEDGLSVTLSATEAALMSTFIANAGKILSRYDLSEMTNGYIPVPFSRSIDAQVSRLRRKLDSKGMPGTMLIRTVWGRGYLFVAEVEAR